MIKYILAGTAATVVAVTAGVIILKKDLACQYSPTSLASIIGCETAQTQAVANAEGTAQNDDVSPTTGSQEIGQKAAEQPTMAEAERLATIDNSPISPTFDIVRVEPDGSTLVAGRSTANAQIILRDGDDSIGETTANDGGEWVIVVNDPIQSPTATLSLLAILPDGTSVESIATVNIAMYQEKAPDVQTGGSVVEQKPVIKLVDAAGEKADEIIANTEDTAQQAVAGSADATSEAVEKTIAQAEQLAKEAAELLKKAANRGTETGNAGTGNTEIASVETTNVEISNAETTPIIEKVASALPESKITEETGEKIAETTPSEAKPLPDVQDKTPLVVISEEGKATKVLQGAGINSQNNEMTFNSMDYNEKGEIIFSGDAKANELVRVYINNEFIGESGADTSGRWSLDTGYVMQAGPNSLRFDQVDETGNVSSRRETNITMPKLAQVATISEPKTETIVKEAATTADTVEETTETATAANPTVETVANTQVTTETKEEPLPEAEIIEVNGGRAIIIWGDNLWNISSKIYGKGELYTTIFKANKGQIRDPNLIYPGQVFLLPEAVDVD
ncbi:MAG: LysM peptidoglycan-binding domain-containing protein [Alphaproteobacteria bacterium]|nr:LysM peptidoglycan-binding domain-containing protein [Alphaproteobacteria bacterium]